MNILGHICRQLQPVVFPGLPKEYIGSIRLRKVDQIFIIIIDLIHNDHHDRHQYHDHSLKIVQSAAHTHTKREYHSRDNNYPHYNIT